MPIHKVTNMSSVSGIRRNGRVYKPLVPQVKPKGKGKVKDNVLENEKKSSTVNDETSMKKLAERGEISNKKKVSAEEATKFLKIIQQIEFKVIKQLNKMPARISLLGLLIHSKPHRKLLRKILSEAHMANEISIEIFGGHN